MMAAGLAYAEKGDFDRGIADFDVYHAGRSKLRQFLKALISRPGMAVCEAEPATGYELLKRVSTTLAQRLESSHLQLMDVYGRNAH